MEAKHSDRRPAQALGYFAELTGAKHAFQVSFDADYVERDCFGEHGPIVVPASTFLSQLV